MRRCKTDRVLLVGVLLGAWVVIAALTQGEPSTVWWVLLPVAVAGLAWGTTRVTRSDQAHR